MGGRVGEVFVSCGLEGAEMTQKACICGSLEFLERWVVMFVGEILG